MFCGKCGAEIKDGAAFCPKCGAQTGRVRPMSEKSVQETAQQPAPGHKKPAALRYALGGVGAAVLVAAGVAAGIAGYRALHKDNAIAESGEKRQTAGNASADAGADAQNLRREALQAKEQELLAQYGVLKSPQSVKSWTNDGCQIQHDRSLDLTGLWSTTVLDFDADGLDEMLVCAAENDTPMLYLYDGEEAGEVAQTDAFSLGEGFWYEGNHCQSFLSVHAVTSGERPKIVCEYREDAGYFADGGAPQYFWIIEYAEQELRYDSIFDYSYESEGAA